MSPSPQVNIPVSEQGATPTRTPEVTEKGTTYSPPPRKVRTQQQQLAGPTVDATTDGPTIANLTAMVQQLRIENRRLGDQLVERKQKVEGAAAARKTRRGRRPQGRRGGCRDLKEGKLAARKMGSLTLVPDEGITGSGGRSRSSGGGVFRQQRSVGFLTRRAPMGDG